MLARPADVSAGGRQQSVADQNATAKNVDASARALVRYRLVTPRTPCIQPSCGWIGLARENRACCKVRPVRSHNPVAVVDLRGPCGGAVQSQA
jgi:hypothetical protein